MAYDEQLANRVRQVFGAGASTVELTRTITRSEIGAGSGRSQPTSVACRHSGNVTAQPAARDDPEWPAGGSAAPR
jgi:hypothetical protein